MRIRKPIVAKRIGTYGPLPPPKGETSLNRLGVDRSGLFFCQSGHACLHFRFRVLGEAFESFWTCLGCSAFSAVGCLCSHFENPISLTGEVLVLSATLVRGLLSRWPRGRGDVEKKRKKKTR